ncbi:MAG: aminodeoxychorismate/anthranilate synthase component II, partial [Sinomicrobium sp.]|nr:aminodeoxychorismate/anthranilate synthase component II [Sinomicrobium sp.]
PDLVATALDDDGYLMSLRHREYNVFGVQYHPESVLTPYGKKILENWLNIPDNAGKKLQKTGVKKRE